jgi:hypothetical protein
MDDQAAGEVGGVFLCVEDEDQAGRSRGTKPFVAGRDGSGSGSGKSRLTAALAGGQEREAAGPREPAGDNIGG